VRRRGDPDAVQPATREFHGLPHEPLPASEWAEHYDLYDTDGVTRMPVERIPLFRALQGEQVTDVELVIAPRDGPRRIVLCNGRALRAPNGTRLGAVVAMHDVTDRVAAEEQLREQTARARAAEVQRQHLERLRELSRLGPGLTATTDLPQLLRRAVLGVRSLVEASGVLLSVSPLGQAAEAATGDPEPGHAVHEVPLPQVDGRLRVSSPDGLDADEQELVSQLGQLVSATAQRIALTEQALQRERRQLRDELLAGVTHDMQTPLAAISGFSQSLLLDLDDDERARAVGALIRQTDVLRQLVLQFLDYVRIRLDRPLRIIEGETRVADAMSKVADLFGSDPRLQVSGLDGHVVAVEQQRLVQVLANLVGNALRHGDGKVSVRIEGGGPGLVTIAVQDEGPGLPDPLREWMTAPTGPPPEGVAGLGIAVTVPLVRALSGTIAAEVDPDGSTTVRVSLPVPGTTGAPAPNAEP
jgi:signal transduction histidine kinase